MSMEKTLRKKSIEVLIEKAEECKDLAKTQHRIADEQSDITVKQHETAVELDALSSKLIADAAELGGKPVENSKRLVEWPDLQALQGGILGKVA